MRLNKKNILPSLKILITSGPTREFIDPVRFISNASTGTLGYEIAEEAKQRNHKVILFSGPTHLKPLKNIKVISFDTALQLKKEVDKYFTWADCIICAAAVGDFRPKIRFSHKIKKEKGLKKLILIKNPDILKGLGKRKGKKILVGFALETENLIINAKKKLKEKNLDFIVVNMLSLRHLPFGNKRVSFVIVDKEKTEEFKDIEKSVLARIILDRVEKLCYSQDLKEGG